MSETVDTRCLKTLFDKCRKEDCSTFKQAWEKCIFCHFYLPFITSKREKMNIGYENFVSPTEIRSRKLNSKNGWGNWILFNNPKVFDLTQKWIIMNDKSILCWEGEMHSKRLIVKLLLPFRAFALVKTTCWLMNTSTLLICHWDYIRKA